MKPVENENFFLFWGKARLMFKYDYNMFTHGNPERNK